MTGPVRSGREVAKHSAPLPFSGGAGVPVIDPA